MEVITLKLIKKQKIKQKIIAELEPIKKRKAGGGVITKDHIPPK